MKWWRMFADIYIIGDNPLVSRSNHPYLDILSDVMVPCSEEWPWVHLPMYVNDNGADK